MNILFHRHLQAAGPAAGGAKMTSRKRSEPAARRFPLAAATARTLVETDLERHECPSLASTGDMDGSRCAQADPGPAGSKSPRDAQANRGQETSKPVQD